jgi:RimJ/RimL family protein N-acetyltransferase
MSNKLYIRPLQIEDALISYQWRNDPIIWRFTGSRPDRYITPEMETAWLESVLDKEDEKRFAICLSEDDRYIGNVFLTDIKNREAQLHIFIGETRFWGKDRACESGWLALEQGFNKLQLELIYMEMHKNNPGVTSVRKMRWKPVAEFENGFVKHIYTSEMFEQMKDEVDIYFKEGWQ